MTAGRERWHEVAELFDTLVELEPAQQESKLLELQASDPDLAREVRALLAADRATCALLDGDAANQLPPLRIATTIGESAGDMLGPYRLLHPLGEGGMGVVWLAQRVDGHFDQQVAIKLLKAGMDSQAILRRFLQERRILAKLQHPNIVRLLDGGTSGNDRPYYVMERVEGETIGDFAKHHQLSVAARVSLIVKIADALAYAHAQLVIHRDLKPSNVMVDAAGEPHVLDFGIAKLIEDNDDAIRTGTGLQVMSPAYATPEQLLGEPISTVTDVYALGLLLFELLVGELPPQRRVATPAQLALELAKETSTQVSTAAQKLTEARITDLYGTRGNARQLTRILSGDLDVIVGKALQRDPARRYGSASAFAADLHRWLNGRPIAARPDSAGYRARTFMRRHRLGVAVASAALLALVAGLGVALWQADRARSEALRADHERANAERQLARSEQVKDYMLALLREQDPFSRAKAQSRTAREIIAAGIAQLDRSLVDDPELQVELRRDLGEIQLSLGDREAASRTLKQAWEQQQALSGGESGASADAQALYASALVQSGNNEEGAASLRDAVDTLRKTLGPEHARTIIAESALAKVEMFEGNFDAALTLLQRGVDVNVKLYGTDAPELVPRLNALAGLLVEKKDFDATIATSRRALTIIERSYGPDHVLAVVPHAMIADALRYQVHYDQALPEMQAAARIARKELPQNHPMLASVAIRLGDLLRRMQRYDEAEQVIGDGLANMEGKQSGEYAQLLQVYGTLALHRNDYAAANERFAQAFAAFKQATGDSTYTWLTAMLWIDSLGQSGDLQAADKLAAEAVSVVARISKDDSYESGYMAGTLGQLRWRQGNDAAAIPAFRRAIDIMVKSYGDDHAEPAGLRVSLARSLLAQDTAAATDEAQALIDKALPIMEKANAGKPGLGDAWLVRAELRLRQDDAPGAIEDLDRAKPLLDGKGFDRAQARRRWQQLATRAHAMKTARG
ncbi:MAG TPA: tetratricopeptide repeat protein [Chiayiivirga sp.]|nr:tetratricopeptide repeat protein [Chiayiivirga sp.]